MKNANFKKVLSILLAIMMMASTCALTFSVSAEDSDIVEATADDIEYTYDYSQTPVYTQATCTEYGYNTYVSDQDVNVTIDVIIATDEPTGHTYEAEDYDVTTDETAKYTSATCTADAYYTVTCADCGETTTVTVGETALGHKYGEVDVVTPSSCTVAGSGTQTCSVCQDTITVELELAEHTFNVYQSTIAATCVDNEITVVKCYYCDATTEVEKEDSATGVCVDEDGNSLCDTCGSLVEGSFWDQIVRFILEFFEVIASWFE